jgi:hypothetical protein
MEKIMKKIRFMAYLMLLGGSFVVRAGEKERGDPAIEIQQLPANGIATLKSDQAPNENIKNLALFVIQNAPRDLDGIMTEIYKIIDEENFSFKENPAKPVLGQYFLDLLRNQTPYENAAIYIYTDPSKQRTLEQAVFGTKTWRQWIKAWFVRGPNVYCTMFENYVKPLLLQKLPSPDEQDLYQDYQNFLAQLFILAQQDGSGKCWDDAILSIQAMGYEAEEEKKSEITKDKSYLLEAMGKSALINYVMLYQMNRTAENATRAEKLKAKYRNTMTSMQSWRYLYFLVTATQALKEVDDEKYKEFINNITQFLIDAKIEETELKILVENITLSIENPGYTQQVKTYLAQTSKRKVTAVDMGGLFATLTWNYREILKDFGKKKTWEILQSTGGSKHISPG